MRNSFSGNLWKTVQNQGEMIKGESSTNADLQGSITTRIIRINLRNYKKQN